MLEPHQRALKLIDVPFRLQGRDPATGLDCLGVVIWAFRLVEPDGPRYQAIDGNWDVVSDKLAQWFEAAPTPASNDLLALRLRRSFHFGVISGSHFVHADAAAGRVVLRRLPQRQARECRIFRLREDL